MNWYLKVIKNYAVFTGRARRKEYWMFFLFNMIISICIGIIEGILSEGRTDVMFLGNIYSLAVLLPSLAVAVRRMHDVGKSGWYMLIPIYNLILAVTEGERGTNEYGPDPKSEDADFGSSSTDTLDDHMIN